MRGFSTATSDQNASVRHSRSRPTRKARARVTDDGEYPVTVTKIEPVIPRERSMSAVKAEAIERWGYMPTLAR